MRKNFRPWAVAGMMVAGLLQTSGVLLAETAPVVHVNAVVKDGTVRLEAEGTAPFEYGLRASSSIPNISYGIPQGCAKPRSFWPKRSPFVLKRGKLRESQISG